MRPLPEIRRARFLQLVKEAGGQTELAKRMDPERPLKSRVVQVGQWAVDPDHPKSRNIGHPNARMLEALMGKPRGWLDTDPETLSARDERVRIFPSKESLATRLDAVTMASALGVLAAIESVNGPYPTPDNGAALLAVYAELEAGGNPLNITARFVNERKQGV